MRMIADPVTVGNINHSTDGEWTDIDCTAYLGADAGNVAGVYLRVENSGGDYTSDGFGVRKNGSSDDFRGRFNVFVCEYVAVGVDSGDIFESYCADASDFTILLLGYWTNDEAEFLTNAQVVTPGSTATWTSTDLSSYFTGTALAASLIFDETGGFDESYGAQDIDGPDRTGRQAAEHYVGAIAPCTGEACEIYASSGDIVVYCNGVITDGFTKFSEQTHDFAGAGAYEDIDLSGNIPAGGVAALFQHHDGEGGDTGYPAFGSRADGATWDEYNDTWLGAYRITQINTTDRDVEQKTSDATKNSYFVGYFTEVSGGSSIAPLAAYYYQMLRG